MDFMKIRFIILALALVVSFGILCGCAKNDAEPAETTGVKVPAGTGETLSLDGVELGSEVEGDDFQKEMEAFYSEQYADMTPEEIAQFEQDLVDLNMTKEQFYGLLYYAGDGETTAATAAAETK